MSTELMIPEGDDIPSYILNPEMARKVNEEATAGISGGFAARIKTNGKQFVLIDSGGKETPVKVKDMVEAPDGNLYLATILLRAKKEIQKAYYIDPYDDKQEGKAPDCFSNDSITPDPSSPAKQCDTCANCPQNAFGSGKDAKGNATAGKACSDNKILAAFVPKHGIHKLKLAPTSLKNFRVYLDQLSVRGIEFPKVITLIGFAQDPSYPVLEFMFGGWVPEAKLPKIEELMKSIEAEEIVNDRITATALPAPAPKAKPKAEPKAAPEVEDDLGLGLEEPDKPEAKAAPAAEPENLGPSDEELAAELGL